MCIYIYIYHIRLDHDIGLYSYDIPQNFPKGPGTRGVDSISSQTSGLLYPRAQIASGASGRPSSGDVIQPGVKILSMAISGTD